MKNLGSKFVEYMRGLKNIFNSNKNLIFKSRKNDKNVAYHLKSQTFN